MGWKRKLQYSGLVLFFLQRYTAVSICNQRASRLNDCFFLLWGVKSRRKQKSDAKNKRKASRNASLISCLMVSSLRRTRHTRISESPFEI